VDPTKAPGIRLAQIFLEEAHFSHRADYLAIPASTAPQRGALDISFQVGIAEDGKHAVLRIRASTEGEANPLYRLSVIMAALVEVDVESPNMPLERYVSTAGGPLLLPFIRQVIANLTGQGRFGPIWLQPVNVRAALETATSTTEIAEPASAPVLATRGVAYKREGAE
jgi:preprotein translocase subunit SecB